jgi:peptide/nickel transport system substrate-binding protein
MDLRNEQTPYVSGVATNPFRDLRVRQAICKAINVSHITKDILKGYAIEATEMVAPAIFGFNEQIKRSPYDPVSARVLMTSAGYEHGFTVRFDFSNNRYRCDEEIGKSIANDLEKIGIHAKVNSMPKEKLFPTLNARDTSFYMVGWYLSTPDASSALDYVIHSEDKIHGYGSENVGGYQNPVLDKLIENSDTMIRQDERGDTLKKAMSIAMQDLPYIPLHVESTLAASGRSVVWTPRPDDFIYAKDIHFKK